MLELVAQSPMVLELLFHLSNALLDAAGDIRHLEFGHIGLLSGSARDRSDDEDALTDGARRANLGTVKLLACQVPVTLNLAPWCRAAVEGPTARVTPRWTVAARASPNAQRPSSARHHL